MLKISLFTKIFIKLTHKDQILCRSFPAFYNTEDEKELAVKVDLYLQQELKSENKGKM